MANWKIPNENRQWRQLNGGDTSGELWSTFNIDTASIPGKVRLARPLKKLIELAVNPDLDDNYVNSIDTSSVEALLFRGDNLYILTEEAFLRLNLATGGVAGFDSGFQEFTNQLIVDAISDSHDAVFYRQFVVLANEGRNLSALDITGYTDPDDLDDWWTKRGNNSLTSTTYKYIDVIRIGTETLGIAHGSKVSSYSGDVLSGGGESATVDLDNDFKVTCFKSNNQRVYIGTYTDTAQQAFVFEWDGTSNNYGRSYPVGAKSVLAMETVDNVPVIVTERGEIKMFNNAGFTKVAQFPFAFKREYLDNTTSGRFPTNPALRPIHPKGMYRNGNTLYIFINSTTRTNIPVNEQTPSGLWTLDLETYSLTHVSSPDNQQAIDRSGPVLVYERPLERNYEQIGRVFIGASTERGSSAIYGEDVAPDTEHMGYFVTPELWAGSVADAYRQAIAKYLLDEGNIITAKYRTSRKARLPFVVDVEWQKTNTFLTTDDFSNASVGDEVELVSGYGAGKLAHITNIERSAKTATVQIDEELGKKGESSMARVDNWKQIDKEMTDGNYETIGINDMSTFVQFKFVMKGANGYPVMAEVAFNSNNKKQNR